MGHERYSRDQAGRMKLTSVHLIFPFEFVKLVLTGMCWLIRWRIRVSLVD